VNAGRDVDALNLDRLLSRFDDHWQPKKIAELNDYDVKLVKLQGEFVWHEHVDTDELFLVLKGTLVIQLRDRDVVLNAGEMFVVPRGVEHCPKAEDEVAAMLIEPRGVVNTGDAGGPLTTSVEDLV
jgi:mannose-6-phosphate isomerase-like protein (cupin superfamily)